MTTQSLIVMDPPWDTDRGGGGRGADCHYPVESFEALWRTIALSPFDPDPDGCLVWCWCTSLSRHLVPSLFERLGVRDTGHERVWVKGRADGDGLTLHAGLGYYGRSAHEYVRLGVIGSVVIPTSHRLSTVFVAPAPRGTDGRPLHSAKPDALYDEAFGQAAACFGDHRQALELFGRGPREGWEVWGNEAQHGPGSALATRADETSTQVDLFTAASAAHQGG